MARDDEIAPAVFNGDDVLVLLDRLRADGFPIGVQEYINAQEIAAAFLGEDDLEPTRLRNWLAPVLCTSPDDQRIFYQRFAAWWEETVPHAAAEELPPPVVDTELDEDVRQIRPWKWRALTALALVLVVPAIVLIIHLLEPEPGPIDDPITGGGDPPPIVEVCKPTRADPRSARRGESAAATQVRVPDLTGLALPEARRVLTSSQLTAGRVIENVNESIEQGQVLRTNPQRGAGVDECSEVNLYVSTGPLRSALEIQGQVVDTEGRPLSGAAITITGAMGSIAGEAQAIDWDPSGQMLALGERDGRVELWRIDALSEAPTVLAGHEDAVWSVAFSPDGRLLASAAWDRTVRLWSLDALGEAPTVLAGHEDAVDSVAFSPDRRLLASASRDGMVRLWPLDALSEAPTVLAGHEDAVYSVAFSPDGRLLASASGDGTVRLWRLDALSEAPTVLENGRHETVISLDFSPDGRLLAMADLDGSIRLWPLDLSSDAPTVIAWFDDAATSVALSPDGRLLAAAARDGTVGLWALDAPSEVSTVLARYDDAVTSVAFSPDGRSLALAVRYGSVDLWNIEGEVSGSARDGTFSVSIDSAAKASLNASLDGFVSPQPFEVPEEPGQLGVRIELAPLPEGWLRELTVHRPEIKWGLFTVPLILTFGWWRWKRYRRRLILERRETRGARSLAAVKIPEPPHGLFHDPTAVRARIEARRRLRIGGGDLDPDATVDETVRKLGWFTPVYRSRLVLPSYLALIDRASFRDQQARLIDEFLDRLVEGGVHVDRYYFNRDPRICADAAHENVNQRSLRELAARYSESILVLCSDGAGLTDPLTGRLDRWTELLESWATRSLMTPVPPYHWSSRELEIAGTGFSIWPATPAGMLTLTEQMQNPDAQVVIPAEWRPSFPELIAAHPARWLERNEPDPDDVDRALRQVRAYLGRDGYRWLCSLAVYPELDWYLTLYLGLELKRSDGSSVLNEEALLSLVRLPWLRHGKMPDWLRARLLAALSREDEQAVRGFLWNLLRARLEAPDSRFRLNIARPQAEKTDRNWRRFFEDILRTEPDDSPLHDMVFVGFLLDKRPRRLQLLAPQNWRRLVYEKGIRMLGVRESFGWLLGILSAFALAALYSPALEALRDFQTAQGESQIIEESWTPSNASSAPFSCWWMENRAPYNYVPSPIPADTEDRCFELNSCGPGGGQSGGGCYKWAQCATCPATDWSTRGESEVRPRPPKIDGPSKKDEAIEESKDSGPSLPSFPMPNVIGLTVAQAEERVVSAGRRLNATSARAVIVGREDDRRPADQIIRQLEAPGTQMRPYMDDVGGVYGQVTFRVVVSAGPGDYSCWWMENKAPYNYIPAPGRVDSEERCFQLNSCGPGGGQSGGGCYKWAECATCPGVDWSSRSETESKEQGPRK